MPMEIEAVDDGTIGKILVPEGAQGIKVNAPIALLLGEGEEASALTSLAAAAPEPPPAAPSRQEQERSPVQDVRSDAAPLPASATTGERGDGRIFASPLARRMAQHAGLDLAAIRGSGPQGRIIKADIDAALSAAHGVSAAPATVRPAAAPSGPLAPPAAPALSKERVAALAGNPPYTERPLNAMRRVIARRLTESKQTVPHFYLT